MSNVIKGLDAIKKMREEQARAAAERDRPKAAWISGKMTDQPFVGRILQEFDETNPLYREDRGSIVIATEHVSPIDFKRRALCTIDTGNCFGCESARAAGAAGNVEDRRAWGQKSNLYLQILADFGEGPKVYVFSRNAKTSFLDVLLNELEDEGNLSGANYRFQKTGEKTTTQFLLKRLKGEPLDDSDVKILPNESFLRDIPYEDQPAFYGGVKTDNADEQPVSKPQAAAASAADDEDAW